MSWATNPDRIRPDVRGRPGPSGSQDVMPSSSLGGTRARRIVVAGRGRRGRGDRGAPLAEQPAPDGAAPATGAPRHRRTRLLLAIAVAVLVLDVVSKVVVVATIEQGRDIRLLGGVLYLTHLRNVGAAFSFAQGATILFTVIAVAVAVVIVRTARRLYSTGWAVALGLVLGGAVGNLVDRVFRAPGFLRGGVVDFLSLFAPDGRIWPVFNVADSAIVCGGILGALLAVRGIEFDGSRSRGDSAEPTDSTDSTDSADDTAADSSDDSGGAARS